jgi:hypothetical protein
VPLPLVAECQLECHCHGSGMHCQWQRHWQWQPDSESLGRDWHRDGTGTGSGMHCTLLRLIATHCQWQAGTGTVLRLAARRASAGSECQCQRPPVVPPRPATGTHCTYCQWPSLIFLSEEGRQCLLYGLYAARVAVCARYQHQLMLAEGLMSTVHY